jgi:hypothetical protein
MKAEVIVPDNYRPADDEPFMNDTQRYTGHIRSGERGDRPRA